jgi:hypothetical protein
MTCLAVIATLLLGKLRLRYILCSWKPSLLRRVCARNRRLDGRIGALGREWPSFRLLYDV